SRLLELSHDVIKQSEIAQCVAFDLPIATLARNSERCLAVEACLVGARHLDGSEVVERNGLPLAVAGLPRQLHPCLVMRNGSVALTDIELQVPELVASFTLQRLIVELTRRGERKVEELARGLRIPGRRIEGTQAEQCTRFAYPIGGRVRFVERILQCRACF